MQTQNAVNNYFDQQLDYIQAVSYRSKAECMENRSHTTPKRYPKGNTRRVDTEIDTIRRHSPKPAA